jgi:RNA polymerase sigma factor for flagellar operon FliA
MKPSKSAATSASSCNATQQGLKEYMPLVQQVVARILRRLPPNVLREDLIAAGTFGLLDALRRNPQRAAGFEWYARVRIRGAVIDELRAQDWLPRRLRTRVKGAKSRGETPGVAVVGFDDLPPGHEHGLADPYATGVLEQVEQRLDRASLARAIATLPEREASIVTWYYFEGMGFRDIAAKLSVSEPRISQLHSRAMARLRSAMEQGDEGRLTSAA